MIRIRTKRDLERNATPSRILATRFFIWCLETALKEGKFPRDCSLWKIELEFRPKNHFGKNRGHQRLPLAERLHPIIGGIVYGRARRNHAVKLGVKIEEWMQQPEIKTMLAEKVLMGEV